MGLPLTILLRCAILIPAASAAAWWWERTRRVRAEAAALAAEEGAADAIRLLRLAASEIRTVSLALIGHSQADPEASRGAVAGLAHRLIGISEDLLRQSEAPDAVRRLEEETIAVMPVLEFAVAQVAAGLGPGRRAWRIGGVPEDARLLADKRALNHILVNVLSAAAASTREGDWIDVTLVLEPGAWLLQIEDEGAGLPVAAGEGGRENRGIGYGLTLARSLMQAHGGSLVVESLAKVGTRVRLSFPGSRMPGGVAGTNSLVMAGLDPATHGVPPGRPRE